ncbi:hypothetical protein HMI55_000631, partial [Coelomomyces lativittatus]
MHPHVHVPPPSPPRQGALAFDQPWPSLTLTLWNDPTRFEKVYFHSPKDDPLSPSFKKTPMYYLTGDTVKWTRFPRSSSPLSTPASSRPLCSLCPTLPSSSSSSSSLTSMVYYTLLGRMDDVLTIAGHRLSTAELEACINQLCYETAVVPQVDPLLGYHVVAFLVLKPHVTVDQVTQHVRSTLGPIYTPKVCVTVTKLPKTRSGKIMRRILKCLCDGTTQVGDVSTLEDP